MNPDAPYHQRNIVTKRRIIVSLLVIALILLVRWAYNTSTIEFSMPTPVENQSVTMVNQETGKTIRFNTNGQLVSQRISRGNYELSVKSGNKTFFAVVKTKSFLRTVKVQVAEKSEKTALFVGDNPNECFRYIGSTLYSYSCSGAYDSTRAHVPATNSLTTYTSNSPGISSFGGVHGIIHTQEGDLALVNMQGGGDAGLANSPTAKDQDKSSSGAGNGYHVFKVGSDLEAQSSGTRIEVSPLGSYGLTNYKNGFIVYDPQFKEVIYYPSTTSAGEKITPGTAKEKNLNPQHLSTGGDKILFLYSSSADSAQDNDGSELVVQSGNGHKNYEFDQRFSSATLCGTGKVCLVGNDGMYVYELGGDSAEYLYMVSGVSNVQYTSASTLIANDMGILSFNADSKSGFYEYLFGGYKLVNLQPSENGFAVSLNNNRGRVVTLYISRAESSGDQIDKKVFDLQKLTEVDFISAYANHIYIGANLGIKVYNPITRNYSYSPTLKKNAATKINQEIDKLQIDRTKYIITSNAF